MPLARIDSKTAWKNLSQPGSRGWPATGSERFMPFALPNSRPSFVIAPEEKVFTIGSCFARNIELALHKLGFKVPTFEQFTDAQYANSHYINKYNVYSMLNEIKWA